MPGSETGTPTLKKHLVQCLDLTALGALGEGSTGLVFCYALVPSTFMWKAQEHNREKQ